MIHFSVSESLCEIMEWIIFNITFTCIIVIACNLFVIETNVAPSFQILIAFCDMLTLVGLSFIYFYFSERFTSNLLEIGEIFYHSSWYRLPKKQQNQVLLPIQRAQREFRLKGLGLFNCSLPVFLSVGHIVKFIEIGYFLIIHYFGLSLADNSKCCIIFPYYSEI